MINAAERSVVLSGLGTSQVARRLDRSPLALTLDAVQMAITDAGLERSDIDGLGTYPGPIAEPIPGMVGPDLYDVQDALGLGLNWHLAAPQGAGQIAPLVHAVLAIAAGLCRHAVVFRTVTEGSAHRSQQRGGVIAPMDGATGWLTSVRAVSVVSWSALYAQRHMHEFGTTREQLGAVAVSQREHATRNPEAIFRTPLDLDEYLASPPISTPLGLLDCDVPVDAATAVVISSADTRAGLRHPVRLEAMGGAIGQRPLWEQWEDMTTMAATDAARQLWSRTDLRPSDVDCAQLYDGFSIFALMWLEAFGFCGRGESGPFVEGGERIGPKGQLPTNTWGGQLSGGRTHGYGFVAEAMRQIRGDAGDRQVDGTEVVAVGVGGGPIAGALLLTA